MFGFCMYLADCFGFAHAEVSFCTVFHGKHTLLVSGVYVTVLWVLLSMIGGHNALGRWSFVAVVLIFGSVAQYFVLRQIFPEEF